MEKTCKFCGIERDIGQFKIEKPSGRRRTKCEVCIDAYQTAYRAANRARLNALAKVYRFENIDTIRAKDKIRSTKPERQKAQNERHHYRYHNDEAFHKAVRASSRKAVRKFYNKNRKSILADLKTAREADPETIRAITRASVAKWAKAHPDKVKAENVRRKAQRRGARVEDFCETKHIAHLWIWQHGLCYHCNRPLRNANGLPKADIEHVVAVTKGGLHSADNVVLADGACNSSKNAKLLNLEWKRKITPSKQRIIWADQVATEFGPNAPLKIISTFFTSERNSDTAISELPALRAQYPDDILAFDWEWLRNREAIRNMVASRMGKAERVPARSTTIQEIDTDNARGFLDRFHLQGFGRGSTYLGLVHDGEIVGLSAWLMVEGVAELNRLAFKGSVVGGFSRMLRHFSETFISPNTPISSFVDPRYAKGASYEKLGFESVGETEHPVYYYVNANGMRHRRSFMKGNLESILLYYDAALSERDNAAVNGYYRVFGLKQKRYVLWNQKSAA